VAIYPTINRTDTPLRRRKEAVAMKRKKPEPVICEMCEKPIKGVAYRFCGVDCCRDCWKRLFNLGRKKQ
jgi:hypothetical protein